MASLATDGLKTLSPSPLGITLKPGRERSLLLFTFSCSGLMKPDLFQKIVTDAALDAGRDGQILDWLSQAADHPVKLLVPESLYLKGLMVKVLMS